MLSSANELEHNMEMFKMSEQNLHLQLRSCVLSTTNMPETMQLKGETVCGQSAVGFITMVVDNPLTTCFTSISGTVFEVPNDGIQYDFTEVEYDMYRKDLSTIH